METFDALADEYGLIAARQAREAGCERHELARLVSSGHWVHLTRGWYALSEALVPDPVDSPAERRRVLHALMTRALMRNFDGRAVASHHSALVLHSLPVFAADLRQVHLSPSRGRPFPVPSTASRSMSRYRAPACQGA